MVSGPDCIDLNLPFQVLLHTNLFVGQDCRWPPNITSGRENEQ